MDNQQQIFCRICNAWFDLLGPITIPPDVYAQKSACGHNLTLVAAVRDKPQETLSE